MKDFFKFLTSKAFLKQLLYISLFLIAVLFAVLMWLRVYTNHGQKLVLDDYINTPLDEAMKSAKDQSFSIIVTDSVHVVGRAGGIILNQNPEPGSTVKENRKIYVTTTKYNADKIKVKDLPRLYGVNYDQAKLDLKSRSIETKIRSKKYDASQPNHILEVWHKGRMIIDGNKLLGNAEIDKGGTLEFVISERQGGSFVVPELVCRTYADAKSYMLYSRLSIGRVNIDGDIENEDEAYIIRQSPAADGNTELSAGSVINITLSKEKPSNCK